MKKIKTGDLPMAESLQDSEAHRDIAGDLLSARLV